MNYCLPSCRDARTRRRRGDAEKRGDANLPSALTHTRDARKLRGSSTGTGGGVGGTSRGERSGRRKERERSGPSDIGSWGGSVYVREMDAREGGALGAPGRLSREQICRVPRRNVWQAKGKGPNAQCGAATSGNGKGVDRWGNGHTSLARGARCHSTRGWREQFSFLMQVPEVTRGGDRRGKDRSRASGVVEGVDKFVVGDTSSRD